MNWLKQHWRLMKTNSELKTFIQKFWFSLVWIKPEEEKNENKTEWVMKSGLNGIKARKKESEFRN